MKRSQTYVGYKKRFTADKWVAALNVISSLIFFHNIAFRNATASTSWTSVNNWAAVKCPQGDHSHWLEHLKAFQELFFSFFKRVHVCSNERVNTDPTVWGGHASVSETLGLDRLQGTRGLGCKSKGEGMDTVSWVRKLGFRKSKNNCKHTETFSFLFFSKRMKFINSVSYNQLLRNC